MFKAGKEIITVDNKDFIRLADAMQVIAPTATNASRWFKQHQGALGILDPETFIYSDERFPGKKNQVWITVPEGFQALVEACNKAARLKIVEGVEDRIAPFVEGGSKGGSNDARYPVLLEPATVARDIDAISAVSLDNVKVDEGERKRADTPSLSTESERAASGQAMVAPALDEVDIEFVNGVQLSTSDVVGGGRVAGGVDGIAETNSVATRVKYKETSEKIYGMASLLEWHATPLKGFAVDEAYAEFLQQTLSNLVASYYAKMCWVKHAQTEAPGEIHAGFTDLTNTLHDTLIENVIADILKYKEPEAPGILDRVEEYLSRGYEISFEVDKEGVLCRVLSGTIGVNSVASNWREALVEAIKQIPPTPNLSTHPCPSTDSLYVLNANGSPELVNDIGEIK